MMDTLLFNETFFSYYQILSNIDSSAFEEEKVKQVKHIWKLYLQIATKHKNWRFSFFTINKQIWYL